MPELATRVVRSCAIGGRANATLRAASGTGHHGRRPADLAPELETQTEALNAAVGSASLGGRAPFGVEPNRLTDGPGRSAALRCLVDARHRPMTSFGRVVRRSRATAPRFARP
jgi:hypothetical protein